MCDRLGARALRLRAGARAALALACATALGGLAAHAFAQTPPVPVPHGTLPDEREQLREAERPAPGVDEAAAGLDLPPVRERADAQHPVLVVRGFRVEGVGDYPEAGIDPERVQALADARFRALAGGADSARLDFDQLQGVAADITAAYRAAGFIVATAYLPAQDLGADAIVRIAVLEGRLGRVVVEGADRYRAGVLAAPAQRLQGRALRRPELESALLYLRDLPGVSAAPVLAPGQHTGETDLLIAASEEARPFAVSLAASNHGTDQTGRYRAQAGLVWRNALGLGDVLTASYTHAFDPQQSQFGAIAYSLPVYGVDGLAVSAGYTRSEMDVNTGPFAALGLTGPASFAYLGSDWKFLNREHLQMQAGLRFMRERSRLSIFDGAVQLSDQRFDVVEGSYTLRHIDRRTRGVNLLQASVRQAVDDRSRDPDAITPQRDSHFTVLRLSLARMQYLSRSQRLFARFYGQHSEDVLVPMEQIAVGGPDSVRSLPVSEALGDRGYHASLEYQVDAPGFGDRASPFGGRPWRDLLQFDLFVDRGRVMPADSGSLSAGSRTFHGAGAGLQFRLPHRHDLNFRLSAAVPVGGDDPSDGDDLQVWARLGMTF
ncbi:ShlB/FhaC/HecB family hemolysin secretion/activation protein [Luteimonas sp. Y-2-2-4F]|nr:ShlB/FhaC/HecB family hemolysin secretion/activation protein [Luteimonas sp. Y-2-2-4F]MCD9032417.1 ShlB/FhaC/HecB family hemolysin secretion/activation protein [Luteimonas sp. Y-2-2-4F]